MGILDTGAQADNPALVNRVTWFKDYVDPTNTTPQDPYGHGTVMAQIIGGTANAEGSGGSYNYGGVAPQSSLYVARIGDGSGNINLNFVPQALSDLTTQGVKLINNSYGSSTPITSVAFNDIEVVTGYTNFSSVIGNQQLMVWAAGNNGNAQPSVEAGLPYYHLDLQHNWISVVNVALNSDGLLTGLDPTSNACGVAASWCLSAPGTTYFSPVAGTMFSTGAGDGTSGAAAVVTGVAALVWQRFPYFNAVNVQETLLTTATPLGDPSVYGYGLVNALKAVNGPAAFNWGAFAINNMPTGTTSVFANDISGTGSLVLEGANLGTLVLSGNNTYTGGTTVESGTLNLTGSLASDVSVGNGGLVVGGLEGSGTINGNVTSSGFVYSMNGGLKINGNYTVLPGLQSDGLASQETDIQVGSPLRISGTATLNSSPVVAIVPTGYLLKTEEPLLYAGAISGTFGPLEIGLSESGTPPVYYTGTLSYTPTEVDVALARDSVASVAEASMPQLATTQQTAQHIETALKQTDQWATKSPVQHQSFLNAAGDFLHVDSIAEAAISINSLSGQLLASSQELTLEQAGIVNRTVADRLTDVGDGGSRQGAWFQGTGASGDIARSGYATGSYSGGGAVAGYDAV